MFDRMPGSTGLLANAGRAAIQYLPERIGSGGFSAALQVLPSG